MIVRLLSAATLLLFVSCASPSSSARDDSTGHAGVSRKKKEKRCVKEFVVGSRLPLLVCEGDPTPQNVSGIGQDDLRNQMSGKARPTNGR